jgi:hypothetical protein
MLSVKSLNRKILVSMRVVHVHTHARARVRGFVTRRKTIAFYVAKSLVSVDTSKSLPHRLIASLFSALSLAQEATARHLQLPVEATIEVGSGAPI